MHSEVPHTRDVVLIGGGHTHALVLRMWGMKPLPGARLTVINPDPEAPYSGMLPGLVAGHYRRGDLMIDLVRLARFAGARLVIGRASGLDLGTRQVLVAGRPPIRFDQCSIDIGITSDLPGLPGFADHATPAKPLAAFAEAWESHAAQAAAGDARAAVVIGGGVAGAELALAMAHRLGAGAVTLVEAEARVLPHLAPRTRMAVMDAFRSAGVTLRTGSPVGEVRADHVRLADGTTLPSDFTAGAAGARPQAWLAGTGLALVDGFVTVGPELASPTDPDIFAVGDIAHLSHAPRPKAGVYAVREAPILFHNLRARLTGAPRRSYHPQKDYLKLISLGEKRAVADRLGLRVSGAWVWRWKDDIDRRFMAKFSRLEPMARPKLPPLVARGVRDEISGQPMCGGCAAKVGREPLKVALADLTALARADILTGPGGDAAILAFGAARQVLTTDTLRAFTEDPVTLARIAAVHAMGDVWAMGARPQAALALVTLPPMSAPLQAATLREIMAAAAEVFAAEGAAIVGGHSALGGELAIGFTVTGTDPVLPQGQVGGLPGDALILTKPLGTGVILAAEMMMKAPGTAVVAALASMARPQGAASRLLAPRAHAMTDVTGFGLAGHLFGLCEASGVAARLDLSALPVLTAAEALIDRGLRSTLHDSNTGLRARCDLPATPRAELVFDPQTAGGLLAAVPAAEAPGLLEALRNEGYDAARIGTIVAGPPGITAG